MRKKSFLLIGSFLLFLQIGNGCSDSSDSQQFLEPLAPETLSGVMIYYLKNATDPVPGRLILYLNTDGSARLYYRLSLCCWNNSHGSYTYETEDYNTGVISVSYTHIDSVAGGQVVATHPTDEYVEYVLNFDDEASGSYYVIPGGGVDSEGWFTIADIE